MKHLIRDRKPDPTWEQKHKAQLEREAAEEWARLNPLRTPAEIDDCIARHDCAWPLSLTRVDQSLGPARSRFNRHVYPKRAAA